MRALYNYLKFAKLALIIGCVVALGVFFWPGALAAVTTFTVFDLSLASVVGTNILFQVAAVAGLTFAGIHALGLAIDATIGLFSLLKSSCGGSSTSSMPQSKHADAYQTSHAKMPQEMHPSSAPNDHAPASAPGSYPNLYSKDPTSQQDTQYTNIYPQFKTN